jgi:hypothetical protein
MLRFRPKTIWKRKEKTYQSNLAAIMGLFFGEIGQIYEEDV